MFQVNLEGNKVRRQLPVGDIPNDTDSRTVYVVKHMFFLCLLNCLLICLKKIYFGHKIIPFCSLGTFAQGCDSQLDRKSLHKMWECGLCQHPQIQVFRWLQGFCVCWVWEGGTSTESHRGENWLWIFDHCLKHVIVHSTVYFWQEENSWETLIFETDAE